jgi:molybdopterin molybdotransferase
MTTAPARMLEVEDAQARVLAEVEAGVVEEVALLDAHDRVLREDIVIDRDAPPADNSAMDGYAVRSADVAAAPVVLRVTGDIPAGHPVSGRLESGTAMRIMTGAFIPDGADTVVQVEWTDGGLESVRVEKSVRAGQNIRRRGEDLRAGTCALRAGTPIGAAEMAMLAQAGRARVAVARRPVVAILSTGDELVDAGTAPGHGQIVNTNAPLLASLVRDAGATPRVLAIVRDTPEATREALDEAAQSDFVITTGGVSVGAYDYVKEALDALGAETLFWQVAMKPGKPVVLSRLRGHVLFGLPGNPASCFVSFFLFVRPALRKALGHNGPLVSPTSSARLTAPIRIAGDRRTYVRMRAALDGATLIASPLTSQGSGSLTSMLGANALAMLEAGRSSADTGEIVPLLLLRSL